MSGGLFRGFLLGSHTYDWGELPFVTFLEELILAWLCINPPKLSIQGNKVVSDGSVVIWGMQCSVHDPEVMGLNLVGFNVGCSPSKLYSTTSHK